MNLGYPVFRIRVRLGIPDLQREMAQHPSGNRPHLARKSNTVEHPKKSFDSNESIELSRTILTIFISKKSKVDAAKCDHFVPHQK